MARDRNDCPPNPTCPPEAYHITPPLIRMHPECETLPDSLNLVVCRAEVRLLDNCNLPPIPKPILPHDPELFDAFMWLLPKILPQPVFWCIYLCSPDAPDCIPCVAEHCLH